MSDFKRGDGLLVCSFCGSVYSSVLEVCPHCKRKPEEKEGYVKVRRIMCGAGHLCPMDNIDPICCISCDGLYRCTKVCHFVSPLRKIEDLPKAVGWDESGNITIYGKAFCSDAFIEGEDR